MRINLVEIGFFFAEHENDLSERSSVVELYLAKVDVESSNLFARSI